MGRVLARKLAAAGHNVKVANSRGPDSISPDVLETGARAATAQDALDGVDVAILTLPHSGFDKIKELVALLPEQTVVIDISNYVPIRDGKNSEIEAGKIESVWVQEYFGRPVAKAWNAILMSSLENKGRSKGQPDRIAVPIAGDRQHDREVAIALMDDTGFDGFDAGTLAESWRLQPASPAYITELTSEEMGPALASAERERLPKRRDLAMAVFAERFAAGAQPDADEAVRIARALYM